MDSSRQPTQTAYCDRANAPAGRIHFESYMPSGYWALAYGKFDRTKRSTISGVLTVPASGGKVPAMILQHGSGGVEQKDFDVWAKAGPDTKRMSANSSNRARVMDGSLKRNEVER